MSSNHDKADKLLEILGKLNEEKKVNKLEFYTPYPYQIAFHHAKDGDVLMSPFHQGGQEEAELALQRALIAANQVGKSYSAAMETAFHATGLYPDWWEGHRFAKAPTIIVAGKRNETVRDVCQNELLGDPFEESALGTGTIPKDLIGKTTRKAGVPCALSAVMVKHVTGGWAKIRFMAFEQGPDAFMGIKFQVGWLDEEPPEPVWTQFIRGVLSRDQYCLYLTFTPEEGVTKVVDSFMNDIKPGQALIRATWGDANHMTPEKQEAFLSQLPPHERDMRSKGIPMVGAGLIFPVSDDQLMVDPFEIPAHWPRICGIDFGWDHPAAVVWMAWDRDTGTAYVYDSYRERKALPEVIAAAIKRRPQWIPIVWPHDGLKEDPKSGVQLADYYRQMLGLNLRPEKFTNPPGPDQKEGQGGIGVEAGLFAMLSSMETGTFKVFSNQTEWFEEKNQYHRKEKDGKFKVVDRKDDLMSATRLCFQSQRFAITQPVRRRKHTHLTGVRNW